MRKHSARPSAHWRPYTAAVGGVGIDLLEVERLERALERRPRLAERVFTDAERAYAAGRARPGLHLAARFCAKEAVAKALGMTAWSWRDVEVIATGAAPELRLSGSVAARAEALGLTASVSLTHTDTTAGAIALLQPARGAE
jgi:holo-[acyl-carrier protein] synthase